MAVASQPRQVHRDLPSIAVEGDTALLRITGMIDEHFPGFGDLAGVRSLVIELSGVTYMTSFGVGRWLKTMAALPRAVTSIALAGCPPIFVDQLNMILNFGGHARIVSLLAPYTCTSCGRETNEVIDVVACHAELARGVLPEKRCKKCNGPLGLDVLPDTYFACLANYGATTIEPEVARLLAADPATLRARPIEPVRVPANLAAADRVLVQPAARKRRSSAPMLVALVVLVVLVIAIAAGAYWFVGR